MHEMKVSQLTDWGGKAAATRGGKEGGWRKGNRKGQREREGESAESEGGFAEGALSAGFS